MLLTTAVLCLSLNIYHESRGESLTGQHAVAHVTMNRAKRDPKNVCQVVTKRRQFSWTTVYLEKRNGMTVLRKSGEPKDKKAWAMAKTVAKIALAGWTPDFTNGALFYHTKAVAPRWSKEFKLVTVIGQHKFYRKYA